MVWHNIHLSTIAKQVWARSYWPVFPSSPHHSRFPLPSSLTTTNKLPAIRGYLEEDGRLIDLQDETYRMSPLIWSVRIGGKEGGRKEGRRKMCACLASLFVLFYISASLGKLAFWYPFFPSISKTPSSFPPCFPSIPPSLPLSLQCVMGHDDVAAWLLARGASVDLVDSGGRSALFYASKIG